MAQEQPLEELLSESKEVSEPPKPQIFDLNKVADQQELQNLFNRQQVTVHDVFDKLFIELVMVRHPNLSPLDGEFLDVYEKERQIMLAGRRTSEVGVWAYFPWKHILVHVLQEQDYFQLRTSYNRHLITAEEQTKFRDSRVAIAGLSSGNSVAFAVALQGGCKHMRLADTDTLALSNINRMRAGVDVVGDYKTHLTAQQIYELDPFADLALFYQGVTDQNVAQFIGGPPKTDVVVDGVDNFNIKVLLRLEARRLGVPVISANYNGDNVTIDVERYDLDQSLPIFGGRMGKVGPDFLKQEISSQEQARLAVKVLKGKAGDIGVEFLRKKMDPRQQAKLMMEVIGKEHISIRMQESLLEIGYSIYAVPQLGTTVAIGGATLAYLARKIILGEDIKSGRYNVSLDAIFTDDYHKPESKAKREAEVKTFLAVLHNKGKK